MNIKRIFLIILSVLFLPACPAQVPSVTPETRAAVHQLVGDILVDGKAYDYDRQLADGIGPRLTGSANFSRAVSWATDQFRTLGLKNVHTEPVVLPAAWEPEVAATGRIMFPREQTLHIYSNSWSPSTPDGGIQGDVLYLSRSMLADQFNAATINNRILLIDKDTFGGELPFDGAIRVFTHLNELHPRAVLVTGGPNGTQNIWPVAFVLRGHLTTMPVAQIGLEDELLIRRQLANGPVTVQFSFKNRIHENVTVQNVVAEIPGREAAAGSPDSVVLLGAHLDSWHPGTGAQDNGTGVSAMLDIARAIQALGRPPRRTIRFVLFAGEEEGMIGSTTYVKTHLAEMPSIDAVFISDSGSEPAVGWFLMGREDEQDALAPYEPLLQGLGAVQTNHSTDFLFETDHAGFDVAGVPSLVLETGLDRYFKLHHQAADTFDSVVQSDLAQGVAVIAATTYAVADSSQPFAPHLSKSGVEDMLRNAHQLDAYRFAQSVGFIP